LIIKLLSTQIPQYWETIKFAAITADEINKEDLQPYLIDLLHDLLSDKAQCWIRIDENRKIVALLITKFKMNKIGTKRSLHFQCIFSYAKVSINSWQEDFNMLIQFAKQENCQNITFNSRHQRIWELTKSFGCREQYRSFAFDLN